MTDNYKEKKPKKSLLQMKASYFVVLLLEVLEGGALLHPGCKKCIKPFGPREKFSKTEILDV